MQPSNLISHPSKHDCQSNSIKLNHPGLNKICIPDPIVFQNLSTGGETFEWDLGDGTKLVKHDTSMVIHQYKNTGPYTVWLKAIDKGTCKVKDSVSVRLNVYIADIRVQEDDNACQNIPYTLQASGGVSYFWRSQDNSFQSTEQNPSVLPNDTTVYIVRVTERSGCVKEDTVQLSVIPTIMPTYDLEQSAECFERPSVHVVSTTDSLWADDHLYFDFGDGISSDNEDITHNYEKDGVFNLRLVLVRDECVTEKVVPLPVFQLKIPNVITPGKKDNNNDNFVIQYGPMAGVTPAQYGFKTSVTIYNRWGAKVYHNDDYQYDWDGDGVEGGVYYYEVTIQDHATCKSWLHVVK
ncbi:MAG: gliding motility-associated C-terminal domain-containing protein [Chryseolinea sp.]